MWLLKEDETFIFKHPFRCYIAGPSFSGKTTLIQKILINQQKMINKPVDRIVFCYKTMQPGYEVFKYLPIHVEFIEAFCSTKVFEQNVTFINERFNNVPWRLSDYS